MLFNAELITVCWIFLLCIHAAFMPRIKAERSFKVESLCNFSEAADQIQKVKVLFFSSIFGISIPEILILGVYNFFHFILFQAWESSDSTSTDCSKEMKHPSALVSAETKEVEVTPSEATEEKSGHVVNVVMYFLFSFSLFKMPCCSLFYTIFLIIQFLSAFC